MKYTLTFDFESRYDETSPADIDCMEAKLDEFAQAIAKQMDDGKWTALHFTLEDWNVKVSK